MLSVKEALLNAYSRLSWGRGRTGMGDFALLETSS
jgi:hypothetical protein